MSDEGKKELIGEVSKNSLETVKVHVSWFRGKVYVDARVYVQDKPTDPTAVIATKKGLCLSPDLVTELLPLLARAMEVAKKDERGGS
ncbi:MAG: transcriptional coactivator p15/PC4 family protein [Candidatus Aminicenantales bacterium]